MAASQLLGCSSFRKLLSEKQMRRESCENACGRFIAQKKKFGKMAENPRIKNILESGRNVHREERRHSLLKEFIFLTRSPLLCLCRMEAPSSGHDADWNRSSPVSFR